MTYRVLLFAAAMALLSCRKSTTSVGDNVTFASYYGFCMGDCVQMYRVTSTQLQHDSNIKKVTMLSGYTFAPTNTLPAAKQTMAASLLTSIPSELLSVAEKTYGCPDCRDQGGIYLVVEKSGSRHSFRLDNDSTADQSASVLAYKRRVRAVLDSL
jgi:hypothetical protein